MRQTPRCALLFLSCLCLAETLFAAAPTISSLSVTSGTVGTSVTINGSNFGNSQGSSTVTFSGVAATPTSWSKTKIVTTVPVNATSGLVKVTVGGNASNGISFTVNPHINNLNPPSGQVGASATINGSGFGPTQGTSAVRFGGASAPVSSWSASGVTVAVPPNAGNPVVVTVGGVQSNGVNFTVLIPNPQILGISPPSATIGSPVTISGSSFGTTPETVTFNGIPGAPTAWNDNSITVPVPTNATTGPVQVTVQNAFSNEWNFTVEPHIDSLFPTSGTVGTTVTVSGSGFGPNPGGGGSRIQTPGVSTITFNGTAAAPISWSDTNITAPVPTGATTALGT